MIAAKYNKGSRFTYELPKDAPFKSLKDFSEDAVITLRGLYTSSKGKFGEEPNAIIDKAIVNLPKHLLGDVKDMMNDEEFIAAVNEGKVGFKVRTYEDTNYGKGTCYSVEWVDLD